MSIFRRRICHELPKLPPVISLKSSEITGSKRINPAITIRFQNELKNFMLLLNTIRSRGIGFLKGWDYMKFTLLILNIDRLYILMKGRRLCLLLCISLSDGIIRGIIKYYYVGLVLFEQNMEIFTRVHIEKTRLLFLRIDYIRSIPGATIGYFKWRHTGNVFTLKWELFSMSFRHLLCSCSILRLIT